MPKIVPIPASILRKIFEKDGFKCVRIEGDHYVFTKQGVIRPIVIPNWPAVPGIYHQKQHKNCRDKQGTLFPTFKRDKIKKCYLE